MGRVTIEYIYDHTQSTSQSRGCMQLYRGSEIPLFGVNMALRGKYSHSKKNSPQSEILLGNHQLHKLPASIPNQEDELTSTCIASSASICITSRVGKVHDDIISLNKDDVIMCSCANVGSYSHTHFCELDVGWVPQY